MKQTVLGICLMILSACGSTKMLASPAVQTGEIQLADYPYAIVYDANKSAMIEVEIDQLLTAHGFKVLGEKEVQKYDANILGVRYREKRYRSDGEVLMNLTFEDIKTDKTLFTLESKYNGDIWGARGRTLKQISAKIGELLANGAPQTTAPAAPVLEI